MWNIKAARIQVNCECSCEGKYPGLARGNLSTKTKITLYWKIKNDEIEITDINNKKLPKDHEVYQAELSFIQDRISEMEFSGEIVMM